MFDDPKPELRVVDEGDGGFGSACDLVVAALEIDGVVVVDAALLAQGKVEVEQRGRGCGAEVLGAGKEGVFPDGAGDEAGAALAGAVLALEFHLEDVVGVPGGGDFEWQKWFQVVSAETKQAATLMPEWSSTVRRRICFCAAGHHWWMELSCCQNRAERDSQRAEPLPEGQRRRALATRRCGPCETGGKCECVEAEPGEGGEGVF